MIPLKNVISLDPPCKSKLKRRASSKGSKNMDDCNKTNTEKNSYVNSLIKNSSRKDSSVKIKYDQS